jgi:hypothetical protein
MPFSAGLEDLSSDKLIFNGIRRVKSITHRLQGRAGRLGNPAGVVMQVDVEKLKIKQGTAAAPDWQKRQLILSSKRIFIIMCMDESEYEIIDSIPLEEIKGVNQWGTTPVATVKQFNLTILVYKVVLLLDDWISGFNSLRPFSRNKKGKDPEVPDRPKCPGNVVELLDTFIEENPSEHVLEISTKPGGFNDGQPYVFKSFKNIKKSAPSSSEGRQNSNTSHENFERVERMIRKLASAYKKVFMIESRFDRLQQSMQKIWKSTIFNFILLFIIVSNFAFTVKGLENTDSSNDAFFERVDIVYTVLFSVGS